MLVFCTSYFTDRDIWAKRYRRWLDHHARLFPSAKLFMIDDGSPYRPQDADVRIAETLDNIDFGSSATVYRFPERLGRPGIANYPGWFRSFTFSVVLARKLGARKIVHIESDAYVLSRAALDAINQACSGWTAFWCPRYEWPESGLQIICEDAFPALEKIRLTPYAEYIGRHVETWFPFTHIDRSLQGNRYGEYRSSVPSYADFAVQVTSKVTFQSRV